MEKGIKDCDSLLSVSTIDQEVLILKPSLNFEGGIDPDYPLKNSTCGLINWSNVLNWLVSFSFWVNSCLMLHGFLGCYGPPSQESFRFRGLDGRVEELAFGIGAFSFSDV